MKFYDVKLIKEFIEKKKDNIKCVECGMLEDWSWTAETIFEDGKYTEEFINNIDNESNRVALAGIDGSSWATPIMNIEYKEGQDEKVECFWEYINEQSQASIEQQKKFAKLTGGMDYKE